MPNIGTASVWKSSAKLYHRRKLSLDRKKKNKERLAHGQCQLLDSRHRFSISLAAALPAYSCVSNVIDNIRKPAAREAVFCSGAVKCGATIDPYLPFRVRRFFLCAAGHGSPQGAATELLFSAARQMIKIRSRSIAPAFNGQLPQSLSFAFVF